MKHLKALILLLIIVSCNKANEGNIERNKTEQEKGATVISKKDIEAIKYIEYVIDAQAEKTLASWQTYTDVMNAIEELKIANFKFFIESEEIFISTLDELETTIPEKIKTEPIKARFLVLKTKLYKLKQQLELSNASKKERLQALKEVFQARTNAILQINKKYEKEAQKIKDPF